LINSIFKSDGISKSELAKELKLSKPAVSKNVADLIAMGLVNERGEGRVGVSGGRKPVMLYFNESHRYIGALDLSFQEPVCAIGDLQCKVLTLKKIQIDRSTPVDEKKNYVWQTFMDMLQELNVPAEKMGAIVISQPGIIGDDGESLYSEARHHVWTGIGLKQYLKERCGVPVLVKNDVNLAAIGEMHLGAYNQIKNLIYVTCGIGLGSGVIIDGKLYEGCNRAAGELGEFLREDGRRVEDAVAIEGLLRRLRLMYAESGKCDAACEKLRFSDVVKLAKDKDSTVNRAVYDIGRELGGIIYNCSVMFDIKTVIFGGEYLNLGKTLFDGIEAVLEQKFPFRPEVFPSSLRESAGIYGGFVVGKDEILNRMIQDETYA